MRKLVWRTPRPGAEPMRGAEAARWYLRFFRDPIRTLSARARSSARSAPRATWCRCRSARSCT